MKQGKGKWKKYDNIVNCNSYTGDYLQDMKHGQGKFVWESGNWYEGQYVSDKRNGYGEMHWTDGTVYKGDWQFGAQHGKGLLILPDGDEKEGIIENNVYRESIEDESQHDFYPDLTVDVAKDKELEDKPEQMKFEEQPPTSIQVREIEATLNKKLQNEKKKKSSVALSANKS